MSRSRCLLAICIAVCLCTGGMSGCSNDTEKVVLEEDDPTAQEKVLRFFSPIDVGSSALYYRELIDQYNRLNKGVRVVYEGISTGDGYNDVEYTLKSENMRPAYETFIKGGQVPIEDFYPKSSCLLNVKIQGMFIRQKEPV